MNRLSQVLLLVAGSFTTALLIAVYLESQVAAVVTWWFFFALVAVSLIRLAVFASRAIRSRRSDGSRSGSSTFERDGDSPASSNHDGLATLRERYTRGELTDEQFERKLDRLLWTDTPENAAEWRDAARERSGETASE
ncbi:SHOCT domain-containing protein [Halococcus agarilyticus]|uniref:SHOCT domain-containing protein n=1 Tax=Halococcus agarilyticus TaxID=1232219 RepID=UPI0006779E33|nr:SHOCT domain-containing protein [Halococcus agarilyticus]